MKIDFTKEFKTLEGEVICKPNSNEPFCLKDAAITALMIQAENQKGEDKAKQYHMATKIYSNPKEVDFTLEELSLIKQLIGKGYGPLIVGQSWEMLEGKKDE